MSRWDYLFVTGTHINVSSFMGLLLLVGVVVKNGILLIDVANRRRAEGASVGDALVAAGKTRLRPIVMTTLAAIGGLFPLALGIGQGAEMERPLAIAVIGGLSTATIFTLVVIPVLYAAFCGARSVVRQPSAVTGALLALFAVMSLPVHAQTIPSSGVSVFAGLSLDAAERAAVATSPDVAGAKARLDQSRYALDAARSGIVPSFVSTYAQVPQGNPPGPNITSRQVSAGLQWTIGDFVAFAPAAREAALTYAAAQADAGAAESAERVKVIGLYFDALKARAVAEARRSALAHAGAQHDAAVVRAKTGDAPALDVMRSDVDLAKAQADLEAALAADQNASEALRIEANAPGNALETTVAASLPPIGPDLLDPQATVAAARKLRPEIASAQLTAQAAHVAVASARAAGFPTLTVGGGYLTGTDSGVLINAPSINANLTIPLGPGAHGRVAVAAAKAMEAKAKSDATERQIVLDVAATSRSLGAAQRGAAAMARARQSAEAELHATELGYRNGASSSLEVASARSTYAQAVVDDLSAQYDLQKAAAVLEKWRLDDDERATMVDRRCRGRRLCCASIRLAAAAPERIANRRRHDAERCVGHRTHG